MKLTRDAIAKRAYEIWQTKGRPEGRDVENWLEAEAQMRSDADRDTN